MLFSYTSLNTSRSALSSTITVDGTPIGSHPVNEMNSFSFSSLSCDHTFKISRNVGLVRETENHRPMPQPVNECLYDKLRRDWVEHFQILTLQSESSSGATTAETESLPHDCKCDGHFKRNTQDFPKRLGSI